MIKYAIYDMDLGRIIVSSYNIEELLDIFDVEKKAGNRVALIKLFYGGRLWEYIK